MDDRRSPKVLLVTDNPEMARIWAYSLRQRMIEVILVELPADAPRQAAERYPDLVVVDVYAPLQFNAIDLCRQIRAETSNPILLIHFDWGESRCLMAYEAGVDECIQKPLSPLLFLAKVQSWMRRSWTAPTEALADLQSGSMRLNPATRQLRVGGRDSVKLSNLEYRLMHALMSRRGHVVESDTLIQHVWGRHGGDAAMLKTLVYRLRSKIEPESGDRHLIQTVPGQGYRIESK
jgi:two-component system KDP operon response regulator KdpE